MAAEIPNGAVIVARAILNSSLWTMRSDDRVVAMTCICIANREPKKWWDGKQVVTIERGQFVRSWDKMAAECGLSANVVRTSVRNLEKCEFLTRKPTRRYSLFTLPKYDFYQDLSKYSDSAHKTSRSETTASPQPSHSEPTASPQQTIISKNQEESKESKETPLPPYQGGGDVRFADPHSQALDRIYKNFRNAKVIGRADTLRDYVAGWAKRVGLAKLEAVSTDSWIEGKTVLEIQERFFKDTGESALDYLKRKHLGDGA